MEYEFKLAIYIEAENKEEAEAILDDIVWKTPYMIELIE